MDFTSESISLTDFSIDREEKMKMFAAEIPQQHNTSQLVNVWSHVYKEVTTSLNCTTVPSSFICHSFWQSISEED